MSTRDMPFFFLTCRRATLSRARRQLSTSQSASETSRAPDPPPNYDDIYFISYPRTNPEAVDFEKLPTYDEALTLPSLQNSVSAAHIVVSSHALSHSSSLV